MPGAQTRPSQPEIDNFGFDDPNIEHEYCYSPTKEKLDAIVNPFKNDRMLEDVGAAVDEGWDEVFQALESSRIQVAQCTG